MRRSRTRSPPGMLATIAVAVDGYRTSWIVAGGTPRRCSARVVTAKAEHRRFPRIRKSRRVPIRDLALPAVVRTGSGVGVGEGGCSPTRAGGRCACRLSRIRPVASTGVTLAIAAKEGRLQCRPSTSCFTPRPSCYRPATSSPCWVRRTRAPPHLQPWNNEMMAAASGPKALRIFAGGYVSIAERAAVLDDVVRGAVHEPDG